MKKSMKYLFVLIAIAMFSCKRETICIKCKETYSKTETRYCDERKGVEEFKAELMRQGRTVGQEWICNPN